MTTKLRKNIIKLSPAQEIINRKRIKREKEYKRRLQRQIAVGIANIIKDKGFFNPTEIFGPHLPQKKLTPEELLKTLNLEEKNHV